MEEANFIWGKQLSSGPGDPVIPDKYFLNKEANGTENANVTTYIHGSKKYL